MVPPRHEREALRQGQVLLHDPLAFLATEKSEEIQALPLAEPPEGPRKLPGGHSQAIHAL